MKKSIIISLFLVAGMCASAQSLYRDHVIDTGITTGDYLFAVMLGAGFPHGDLGKNMSTWDDKSNLDWGKTGLNYGFSLQRFVHDYFGLGLEVSGFNTRESSLSSGYNGTSGRVNTQAKTDAEIYNIMLSARLNVNPQHELRVYIPFGAGVTVARMHTTIKEETAGVVTEDEGASNRNSLGYFAGLGIERNVWGEGGLIGLEGRYSNFGFHGSRYDYFSALLKFGYRF